MNWLRGKLRAWFGFGELEACMKELQDRIDAQNKLLDSFEEEVRQFRAALKARAAESKTKQVYTDYESSQQAVLAEFEEKNGVRS